VRTILGAVALVFAGLLLVLPAVRVSQGRLEARRAVGLWISGAAFLWLAAVAFFVRGSALGPATFAGVMGAVIGNVVQRRSTGG